LQECSVDIAQTVIDSLPNHTNSASRRKSMKRLGLGLFAAALLVGGPAAAQGTIKVGVPMPLSGPAALYGEPAVKGARMFVEELNAAGGVLGKKIELVVRDSKASADEAVRVSREMILKE